MGKTDSSGKCPNGLFESKQFPVALLILADILSKFLDRDQAHFIMTVAIALTEIRGISLEHVMIHSL